MSTQQIIKILFYIAVFKFCYHIVLGKETLFIFKQLLLKIVPILIQLIRIKFDIECCNYLNCNSTMNTKEDEWVYKACTRFDSFVQNCSSLRVQHNLILIFC